MAEESDATVTPMELLREGRIIPSDAPSIHATGIRIGADSNEVSIVFQSPKYLQVDHPKDGITDIATLTTVAVVGMSPQTAKDLLLLLGDQIADHEKEYGEIMTAYMRRRSAAASA